MLTQANMNEIKGYNNKPVLRILKYMASVPIKFPKRMVTITNDFNRYFKNIQNSFFNNTINPLPRRILIRSSY